MSINLSRNNIYERYLYSGETVRYSVFPRKLRKRFFSGLRKLIDSGDKVTLKGDFRLKKRVNRKWHISEEESHDFCPQQVLNFLNSIESGNIKLLRTRKLVTHGGGITEVMITIDYPGIYMEAEVEDRRLAVFYQQGRKLIPRLIVEQQSNEKTLGEKANKERGYFL